MGRVRTKPVKRLDVKWGNETNAGTPGWMIRCAGSKSWSTLDVYGPTVSRLVPTAVDAVLEHVAFHWAKRHDVPLAHVVDVRIARETAEATHAAG